MQILENETGFGIRVDFEKPGDYIHYSKRQEYVKPKPNKNVEFLDEDINSQKTLRRIPVNTSQILMNIVVTDCNDWKLFGHPEWIFIVHNLKNQSFFLR